MFKKIPGSPDLRINLDGTIINLEGRVVPFKQKGFGKIKIRLFGKEIIISKKRLALISWFEPHSIPNLEDNLSNFCFQKVESNILRLKCGYIQYFKKPIEHIPGFMIIPSFPDYAIDLEGRVIDIKTNTYVDKIITDTTGYPVIYVYSPDRGGYRYIRIHRLKCLAWLPNPDYNTRPYINHINGVKDDNRLINLEWASATENSQHAIDSGLNDCCVKMKVRDAVTGIVEVYNSVAEMSRILGVSGGLSKYSHLYKLPGHLYRGRYEIKPIDDDSPWFYEDRAVKESGTKKPHFIITVTNKLDGKTSTYLSVKEVIKALKIRPPSDNINVVISMVKEKFPNLTVTYLRKALRGPYYAKNLTSGKLVVANSLKELSGHISIGHNELQIDLTREYKYIYPDNWIVTTNPNCDVSEYVTKPKRYCKIESIDVETGEVIVFDSITDLCKKRGLDRKTVTKYIKHGNTYRGYDYRAVS